MRTTPRWFFVLIDALVLVGSFLVAYAGTPTLQVVVAPDSPFRPWIEFLSPPPPEAIGNFRPLHEVAWVLIVMVAATFLCMSAFNAYRPLLRQSRSWIVVTTALSSATGLAFLTLVLFALRSPRWSRLFIFSFTVLSAVGLCTYRLLLRSYWHRRYVLGLYAKAVALIGPSAAIEGIVRQFGSTASSCEYRFVGYFSLDADQPPPSAPHTPEHGGRHGARLRALGDVGNLGNILIHEPIDEVIAVQPSAGGSWLRKVIDDCDYFRVTLRIVPEALVESDLRDLKILHRDDPLKLPDVILRVPELGSHSLFLKRLIDVVASAALLVLLAPLFFVVALLIKLTTRHLPVFYRYQAVGYQGRSFVTYKFTSMVADAEQRKGELIARNEMTGPVFKIRDDPRVTTLGRHLRKFSLDELPQLWSVLKGDMSLVGPRPAPPHEVTRYELWHKRKLSVRPGMTCLWQVSGRNRISNFDDWVRMDFDYINNWSLWLDFKILLRTAWIVLKGTGW